MPITNLTFCIENIPASETLPFQLSVETTTGDHIVVCKTEDTIEMERHVAQQVNIPSLAKCQVRILIAKRNIDSVQSFNIEKEGPFILIRREEGKGLQLVQRKLDDKFGTTQTIQKTTSGASSPRQQPGFVVDPKTGQKRYVSKAPGTTTVINTPLSDSSSSTSSSSGSILGGGGSSGGDDVYAQIEKLGQLRDRGILTEEEFQQQKKKLLGL